MQTSEVPNCDTEILTLFREYQALKAEFIDQPLRADDADEPSYNEMAALKHKIMALPCACAADFAAKVIIDTENGEVLSEWRLGQLWKEARELVGMPLLGVAKSDMKAAHERLRSFGEWTGTTPPKEILDADRSFTEELLIYCDAEGFSLDWLIFGDVRGLVIGARNHLKAAA